MRSPRPGRTPSRSATGTDQGARWVDAPESDSTRMIGDLGAPRSSAPPGARARRDRRRLRLRRDDDRARRRVGPSGCVARRRPLRADARSARERRPAQRTSRSRMLMRRRTRSSRRAWNSVLALWGDVLRRSGRAFANLHRASARRTGLVPLLERPAENPWMTVPLARRATLPRPPPPDAPGPFSFAAPGA